MKKVCTTCGVEKPLVSFCKNKNSKDGYNWRCKDCANSAKRAWRAENVNRVKDYNSEYNAKNYAEKIKPKRFAAKDYKEKVRDRVKRYYEKNKNTLKYRTMDRSRGAKRRASKLQRTPSWLTLDQTNQIKEVYRFAAEMTAVYGVRYEVDHIHPLQGKNFSGLHVPWNLQVIPRSQNASKQNKLVGAEFQE